MKNQFLIPPTLLNSAFAILGTVAIVALVSCASKPRFQPDVGGAGANSKKNAVIYSIPPNHPVLKMKLVSAGVNNDKMLVVRLFIKRTGESVDDYLDPREQVLTLPDSRVLIYPGKVHASSVAKPVVKIGDASKQAIELLFPLPSGEDHYAYFNLKWKIHYRIGVTSKTMSENERFEAIAENPVARGVGEGAGDSDFPFDDYGPFPEGWMGPDMMWW